VYVADPHPYPDQRLTIGSPSSPVVEGSDASYVTFREARDMTGDGYPDLAITQQNYGSGGCGVVRLVDGRTFTELFRRDGCDHGLDLRKHVLMYSKATYPRGCQMAHGCGSKDVWMKWNGAGWDVVDVARSVYEQ
jgi:hypothetical protein